VSYLFVLPRGRWRLGVVWLLLRSKFDFFFVIGRAKLLDNF